MPATVRVPQDIYDALREIQISLSSQYYSAAPSIQDLVKIALSRFIEDWRNSPKQEEMLEALLECRSIARSRMGKRADNLDVKNQVADFEQAQ